MVASARKSTLSPAFQFYPADFLSSTKVQRMSLTERGAYITLLANYWLDGGLPDDPIKLSRMLHIPLKQFVKMWKNVLVECFTPKDGRLINDRLERERKKQIDYRKKQALNGAKGGRPNANPSLSSGLTQPQAKESFSSLSLSSSSSSSSSSEKTERARPGTLIQPRRKDAAWEGARVYVPQRIHSDFVGFRNHPGAERELFAWYEEVAEEWTTGRLQEAALEPDMLKFWRARYAEKWPAAKAASASTKPMPDWIRRAREGAAS